MKSASSFRRGTGFERKSSRCERRFRTTPLNPNAHNAHKLGTGKQRAAQKHQTNRQRLASRRTKFNEQRVFMDTEPCHQPVEKSAKEQAWEQHLLLLVAEQNARMG
jgi:hypothetical protein